MKTRKVELKGWANIYDDDMQSASFYAQEAIVDYWALSRRDKYSHTKIPCTVILEIPEPERTVMFSEGQFDDLLKQVLRAQKEPYISNVFFHQRKRLFGKGGAE